MGKYNSSLSFSFLSRNWYLETYADFETLWNNLGEEAFGGDERIPYWTELWPSGFCLAAWLYANHDLIKNKKCLDLGCGLGFTALVAAWLGAEVAAMDYEKASLVFAKKNSILNEVNPVAWLNADWRKPPFKAKSFDFIWASDIMYEKRFALPVADFLDIILKDGGVVWIAEPSRSIYDFFYKELISRYWQVELISREKSPCLLPNSVEATVCIWELTKGQL